MNISIPRVVTRTWDAFVDWGDVRLWRYAHPDWNGSKYTKPNIELRRIDLVIAASFLLCTAWYGYTTGWRGAVMGGVTYVLIATGAMLFRK
jgi:hypothetical protein